MKKIPALAILLLLAGCSAPIQYSMRGIAKEHGTRRRNLTVRVEPFADKREEGDAPYKEQIFNILGAGEGPECFNFEKNYARKPKPADELTRLFAAHLDSARAFQSVQLGGESRADLKLSAEIASFAMHATINEEAQTTETKGMRFGLVGALMTASANDGKLSSADSEIRYSNIRLTTADGLVVVSIPEFATRDSGEIAAVTQCFQLYPLINERLRKHNIAVIDSLLHQLDATAYSGAAEIP